MEFIRKLTRLKVLTNKFAHMTNDDPRFYEVKQKIEDLSKELEDLEYRGGEIK